MRTCRILILLMLFSGQVAAAEEWPHWLGPHSDGISSEKALTTTWPASGLRKVWTVAVGHGFSSPIGVDGRVYLFHSKDGREYLTSFDAATGHVVWEQSDEGEWDEAYPGTRATPTIEGAYIYTYGGRGDLTARMQATGLLVWRVNVLKQVGAELLHWGAASSPLIVGNLIYVQTGRGGPIAAAVNKETGALVWKSDVIGNAGYAAPVLIDVDGTRQLILAAEQQVVALNPDTGQKIWALPFHMGLDVDAMTPVYRDGRLLVSAYYGGGSMQLSLGRHGPAVVWSTKQLSSRINPAIYDRGYLYMNSEGRLKCVDWKTGDILWTADLKELALGVAGSLVRVGNKAITLSDHGTLSLIDATPTGMRKLSEFRATKGGMIFVVPLLYRNRIYVRGEWDLTAWEIP